MNEIKSFTFYNEYAELIDNLSTEDEKKDILLAIFNYVFNDVEPELKGMSKAIFKNLKRPIEISKNRSKASLKYWNDKQEDIQTDIQTVNQKDNQTTIQTDKHIKDVYVNVNVKDNNRDNRGMGEEEKEEEKGIDDVSKLKELPSKDTNDTSRLGEMSKEIINYLNKKAGTKYRASSKNTHSHINARISEGFTIYDFKTVIDKKCASWLNDEKMSKYLRPETLFGTKFEGYLNEPVVIKSIPKTKTKSFQQYSQREYDDLSDFYDIGGK